MDIWKKRRRLWQRQNLWQLIIGILVSGIWSIYCVSTVLCETGDAGQAARYLRIGVGARAMGMGGTFVGIADDASATYWNPAGLTQLENHQILAMYSKLSIDRSYNCLHYTQPIINQPSKVGFGISIINFGVDNIEEWTADEERVGTFRDAENTLLVTYARQVGEGISLGMNIKYLDQRMDPKNEGESGKPQSWGLGLDLGALYEHKFSSSNHKINLGVTMMDIGSFLSWDTGQKDNLPLDVKLGCGYKYKDRLVIGADLEKVVERADMVVHTGAEYWFSRHFALRAGIYDTYPTGGLSFVLPLSSGVDSSAIQLDYAFSPDRFSTWDEVSSDDQYNHRVSLSISY